ncbi:MAG: hypothetical protein J6I49_07890, partial [Bacteroidales bacterium]|nr:hypothetical protein [Bacteroidales bacterium]
ISIASLDHISDHPTDSTSCHAAALPIFTHLPFFARFSRPYLKRKSTKIFRRGEKKMKKNNFLHVNEKKMLLLQRQTDGMEWCGFGVQV